MIEYRWDVLNLLAARWSYETYLEIGCAGGDCFGRVLVPSKESVDPFRPATHKMTSDDFFDRNPTRRWDLIFVDGLHTDVQSMRDAKNALFALRPAGTVVLHDCLPNSEIMQADARPGPDAFWILELTAQRLRGS